jgi:hypothetical protein
MKLNIEQVMQQVEAQQRWIITVEYLLAIRDRATEGRNSPLIFGIDAVLNELGYEEEA